MFIYIIIPLFILAHLYLFLRLNAYGKNILSSYSHKHRVALIIFTIIVCVFPLCATFMPDSTLKFLLAKYANIWFGFFMYFGGFLFLSDLLLLIVHRFYKPDGKTRQRHARVLFSLIVISSLALNIYGTYHARDTKVTNYNVHIAKKTQAKKLRIVMIADLHMSVNSKLFTYTHMVDLINAQKPDLVLVAGDIFTSTYNGLAHSEQYSAALAKIKATYGTYAVYGNHDNVEPLLAGFPMTTIDKAFRPKEMDDFMADAHMQVLNDEVITIHDEFVIAGRQSGEKTGLGATKRAAFKDVIAGVDTTKPVIVLQHEPSDYQNIAKHDVDLVLAGHTHDGQLWPGNVITRMLNEANYGDVVVSGVRTIVTSGVGFYGPPLRVGTISEITVIDLTTD